MKNVVNDNYIIKYRTEIISIWIICNEVLNLLKIPKIKKCQIVCLFYKRYFSTNSINVWQLYDIQFILLLLLLFCFRPINDNEKQRMNTTRLQSIFFLMVCVNPWIGYPNDRTLFQKLLSLYLGVFLFSCMCCGWCDCNVNSINE